MRSLHTPQQETNVAYNPGVSYRGGEFIAQGISQAGNAITAGLQRYAQNREESAALDMSFQTRAQPLLEEMQKFSAKDGQVSPAAGLVDKGADWHKFSSSQKKAFLADVVIMGDKQDRARRQQQDDDFRKAAQKLQQDQFTQLTKNQADMLGVSRQGMALEAMRTLGGLVNQYRDDTRAGERLTLEKTTNARVEAERAKALREQDAFFGQAAQGYDMADKYPGVALPMTSERLAQIGASTRGISPQALINLAEFSERRNDPIARDAAETARINALASRMNAENNQPKPWWMGAPAKAMPPIFKTVKGKDGVDYKVPMSQADYAAEQAANPPPAELKKRGDRAAFEEELRQHETALKAGNDDRYGPLNAFSRQNRVVELKRKLAELGAGPAPAASSPGRGQAIRYKLVNGQLVSE
jgi:hypothetical protein